jgi:hypothetical protein
VQVHISDPGGGQFNVVGLADKAVAESRERVRAALSAIGLALPFKRITVNLAPADLPKEGSHYDLPIALGLLAAMGVIPASEMAGYVALGELSLDAAVRGLMDVLRVSRMILPVSPLVSYRTGATLRGDRAARSTSGSNSRSAASTWSRSIVACRSWPCRDSIWLATCMRLVLRALTTWVSVMADGDAAMT